MVKKTNFGPDFGPFWPKFGPQKKLSWVLPLTDVIHCCNVSLYAISKKTNEQNLRKWQKKLVSSPILVPLARIWSPKILIVSTLILLDVIHCCKLSLYAISRENNEPNLRKWQKTWFQTGF